MRCKLHKTDHFFCLFWHQLWLYDIVQGLGKSLSSFFDSRDGYCLSVPGISGLRSSHWWHREGTHAGLARQFHTRTILRRSVWIPSRFVWECQSCHWKCSAPCPVPHWGLKRCRRPGCQLLSHISVHQLRWSNLGWCWSFRVWPWGRQERNSSELYTKFLFKAWSVMPNLILGLLYQGKCTSCCCRRDRSKSRTK